MLLPINVDDDILIDEAGIETGRYGRFHLKSAYQIMFRREGRNLAPWAVEGLVAPFHEGARLPAAALFAETKEADRPRVETLCRALHCRNFHHLDAPWLLLFFNLDPGATGGLDRALAQVAFMGQRLSDFDLDPTKLVCEVTERCASDEGELATIVNAVRDLGIGIAIDDYGAGESRLERVRRLEPDYIKLDGRWFRDLSIVPSGSRLLRSLIAGFRDMGVMVLVEGIETGEQLEAALDSGANYFQGFHLHRPALAGTLFDLEPRPIQDLLRRDGNVLGFARPPLRSHQAG